MSSKNKQNTGKNKKGAAENVVPPVTKQEKKSNAKAGTKASEAKGSTTKGSGTKTASAEAVKSKAVNSFLWGLVVLVLGLVIFLNEYYSVSYPFYIRIVGVIIGFVIAGFLVYLTNQGRGLIKFILESGIEFKKIYWPTRSEAMQTTFIVVGICFVVALLIWGLDGIISLLVGFITTYSF